jgi:2-oxoglutarate dehydrogenase E1 component
MHEVLDDPQPPAEARRLLLCSGKVFYDLVEARGRDSVDDAAIVRVEQLYPFHHELLQEIIEPYMGAEDVVWVQEEPQNRGAWSFVRPRLEACLPGLELRYAGREASASPATGSARIHREQQDALVHAALHGEPASPGPDPGREAGDT